MRERTLGYRIAQAAGWGVLLSILGIFAYAAFKPGPDCVTFSEALVGQRVFDAPPCPQVDDTLLYEAHLDTSLGRIDVVLDPSISPRAVNTFIFLARTGWYDGSVLHRIERTDEHAFAQGGAANPDGTGHAGFLEEAEPPSPVLRYTAGVMAMVVSGDPAQTSSQFFIVGEDWDEIGATTDGLPIYPPLGRVFDAASFEVLQRIIALGSENGTPEQTVVLERVTIDEIDPSPEPSSSPTPIAS